MTDHQLAVSGFLLSLAAVLVPLYLWLSRKLDLVSRKQMQKDLGRIERLGIAGAAEDARKKMIRCLCFAAYLICGVIILHFIGISLRPLQLILAFAAALLSLSASSYGETATPLGVENRKKRLRKWLDEQTGENK